VLFIPFIGLSFVFLIEKPIFEYSSMSIIQDILKLSPEERIKLMEEIWKSIPDAEKSLTKFQESEIDYRLQKSQDSEARFFTWEEVKNKLKK